MRKALTTIFTIFFALPMLGLDGWYKGASQPIICRGDEESEIAYDPELKSISFKEEDDFAEWVPVTAHIHGEQEWLNGSLSTANKPANFILKLPLCIEPKTKFMASLTIQERDINGGATISNDTNVHHLKVIILTCEMDEEDVSALAF